MSILASRLVAAILQKLGTKLTELLRLVHIIFRDLSIAGVSGLNMEEISERPIEFGSGVYRKTSFTVLFEVEEMDDTAQ